MPATMASDSITEATYEVKLEENKNTVVKRTLESEQLKAASDDVVNIQNYTAQ